MLETWKFEFLDLPIKEHVSDMISDEYDINGINRGKV